jgi:hypothetical protein
MIRGELFTRYFLDDGIRGMDQYRCLAAAEVTAFAAAIGERWAHLEQMPHPSEAETEAEFIFPILGLLGWEHVPQQEPGKGHRDIADALLFVDAETKARARPLPTVDRFRLGAVVVENEARDTRLDRGSDSHEAPSSQILRYLGRAEAQSGGALRWGLLTNGRFWRFYWAQARARAEGFIEIDLPALVGELPPGVPTGADPQHWLRVFMLLFRRNALVQEGARGETFLDLALAEGRRYEQQVTEALSRIVFERVYPELVSAIGDAAPDPQPNDQAWRTEVRDASLRLLFRFLFLLYAEDRDLLPIRHDGYRQYGLQPMRDEAAAIVDGNRTVSDQRTTWWPRLTNLFSAIANGDTGMGLPPYNGGLFDDREAPLLSRIVLPDRTLAGLIDALSREADSRRWINYRDLSVQHLGSIYERLLEREVAADDNGRLELRPSIFARKTTGSYYTPEELVRLILRRAVGTLLAERRQVFTDRADALASDRRPKAERLRLLSAYDPAEAFVRLRVCDPAMGSGHFLVSLVAYLADEVLTAVTEAPTLVTWANAEQPYRSPLSARIEQLRAEIRRSADENGWPVPDEQLDDRHLVRRIILKRVIYGVDLNPMAVELAKLSLWLHSFTVGAPLSFLDHHLRCGDSLFGEFVGPVERELHERYGLVFNQDVVQARQAAAGMARVEELADADIGEVRSSREGFAGVEETTAALRAFLDLTHTARWLISDDDAGELARELLFGGSYGNPVGIAAGEPLAPPREEARALRRRGRRLDPAEVQASASAFVADARALAAERRFFHWEPAFPGVWTGWESATPSGGFDAVIGNPPWDRMKLQEVEWFAARVPEIAHAQRAAERKRMVAQLRRRSDPISAGYDHAAWTAETAVRVARTGGTYPMLSGGDVNIYSLFVERALRLVRRDGIVGLLVPSGIAADKGAAEFFRSISTTGRLAALLDFENRRPSRNLDPFFPDVDSRFKFCALVAGGPARTFDHADCAFFKQDAVVAEREALPLAPEDFAAVNPNTGTAPVFRSRRDAEITIEIYRRLPVLVDRRGEQPVSVWPVRYFTMFHMTNDSDKFCTAEELARVGAYRVAGQHWERGDECWLPLYEGKMVQLYDHRAATVLVNANNLNRPAQPSPASDAEHWDPRWSPAPQFWVQAQHAVGLVDLSSVLVFKDVTSPTNARTMIAAFVPATALGNTLPAILPDMPHSSGIYRSNAAVWLGNLNSLIFDYVARQKVQGQHLNWYIVEQLPVIPTEAYARRWGPQTAAQIIREDVLHLTYTADDMAAFARDQGYEGPPFRWDEDDRLRRRARLDALFFHLYGLDREAAEYVLGTFPIVKREEEERWGHFRSRDLILAYMAALAAGAPDAEVTG